MRRSPSSLVLFLALAIGACGGTEDAGPAGERPPASSASTATASAPGEQAAESGPSYTREQIIAALGVTPGRDANGVPNSDLRIGCFASRIFVSPADNMAAYREIGDPLATNRHGNVGVAVGAYQGASESRCLRVFRKRLAKLE